MMSDWLKGKTYLDPDMTQDNGGEWVHIEDVESLLAENDRQRNINSTHLEEHQRLFAEVRVANKAFEESDAACAGLEDFMRDIQAATSDKAVLAITDKALCDPVSTKQDEENEKLKDDNQAFWDQ